MTRRDQKVEKTVSNNWDFLTEEQNTMLVQENALYTILSNFPMVWDVTDAFWDGNILLVSVSMNFLNTF